IIMEAKDARPERIATTNAAESQVIPAQAQQPETAASPSTSGELGRITIAAPVASNPPRTSGTAMEPNSFNHSTLLSVAARPMKSAGQGLLKSFASDGLVRKSPLAMA